MQESGYRVGAVGQACGDRSKIVPDGTQCVYTDFGMSQIHYETVQRYNFDKVKLLMDEEYSINAGAKVLAWFHKTYLKSEPTMWWTRYNCGTRKNVQRPTCIAYRSAVERWM